MVALRLESILLFSLRGVLSVGGVVFLWMLLISYKRQKKEQGSPPKKTSIFIACVGFVAYFLDTLGIGSFAIKTASFKGFRLIDDKILPGTLNAQCAIPTALQALIFTTAVSVDPITLIALVGSGVIAGSVGATVVSGFNRQTVRVFMSIALLVVASLIFCAIFDWFPIGGEAMELRGNKLMIGMVGTAIAGALMNLGIGIYAPCMTLLYLLGMNPIAAFPIMMSMAALLGCFSAVIFMRKDAFSANATALVLVTGSVGVVVAAFFVTKMDITLLRWLMAVVLLYTAWSMWHSYCSERKQCTMAKADSRN